MHIIIHLRLLWLRGVDLGPRIRRRYGNSGKRKDTGRRKTLRKGRDYHIRRYRPRSAVRNEEEDGHFPGKRHPPPGHHRENRHHRPRGTGLPEKTFKRHTAPSFHTVRTGQGQKDGGNHPHTDSRACDKNRKNQVEDRRNRDIRRTGQHSRASDHGPHLRLSRQGQKRDNRHHDAGSRDERAHQKQCLGPDGSLRHHFKGNTYFAGRKAAFFRHRPR